MRKTSRVPQWVAKSLDLRKWGIPQEYIDVLQQGPRQASYWKVWDAVLQKAERVVDGKKYKLKQCYDNRILIASQCFDYDTRAF